MRDTKEKFAPLTIILHWTVGLTIIGLVGAGIFMSYPEEKVFFLYPIHKSIGVLIFVVILARVVWRIMNGWPEAAADYKAWEHKLAKVVHWALIIATVLMPVSGMMMSGLGGHGIAIFGLELMASNYDPVTKEAIASNPTLAGIGHEVHEIVGWALLGIIGLHVAGALKHHVIDKDGTLKRMLGKSL